MRFFFSVSKGDGGNGLFRSELADIIGILDGVLDPVEYALNRFDVPLYADSSWP